MVGTLKAPVNKRGFEVLKTKTEMPLWYCVKTLYNSLTGKMESEIVKDEETGLLIAIQSEKKPLDGVFESVEGTTYYTYHDSYDEAAKLVAAASI